METTQITETQVSERTLHLPTMNKEPSHIYLPMDIGWQAYVTLCRTINPTVGANPYKCDISLLFMTKDIIAFETCYTYIVNALNTLADEAHRKAHK